MPLPAEVLKILPTAWAETGDRTDPDAAGLTPPLARSAGWPASFSADDGDTPRRRVFNQLLHEITRFVIETVRRGILEWDATVDYPENAIVQQGANLYRATVATGPTTSNATDPTTPAQSVWSTVTTARTSSAPNVPNAPVGVVGNGLIDWEWPCPQDNGSVITRFTFQWRREGTAWTTAQQAVITHPSHLIQSGLTNGVTYEARVRAENAVGQSDWSGTGRAVPVASRPARIFQVIADPSDRAILLTFPTPDDGGSSIISYEVQWKSGVQGWSSSRQRTATSSPASIPTLVNGTAYDVRIRAVNSVGDGDWSNVVTATPAPGDLIYSASGSATWPWRTGNGRVVVSSPDRAPARDSARDISLGSGSWVGAGHAAGTLWFVDSTTRNASVFARAYTASSRARNSALDIELSNNRYAVASDGITLWFADINGVVLAYNASTRTRDAAKDINLGTRNWQGAASDGTTLWFVDDTANFARAYNASTRARDSAKDINLGTGAWAGMASDGTTLWFLNDSSPERVIAYTAQTRVRNSSRDAILDGSPLQAFGLVSDGASLWVVEDRLNTAMAYTIGSGRSSVSVAGRSYGHGIHALSGVSQGAAVAATIATSGDFAAVYPRF